MATSITSKGEPNLGGLAGPCSPKMKIFMFRQFKIFNFKLIKVKLHIDPLKIPKNSKIFI